MAFGRLTVSYPNGREQTVALNKGTIDVGSEDGNDVVLRDSSVAAHHAQLRCDASGCEVVDLGSPAGTFVGAVKLFPNEPEPLGDNMTITLGRVVLTYRMRAPDGQAAGPKDGEQPRGWRNSRLAQFTRREWPRRILFLTEAFLIVFGIVAGILVVRARYFGAAVPGTGGPGVSRPTAVPAAAPAQAQIYVVAVASGQRLNVRAGPSQTAAVLGRLANGTEVRAIEGPVAAGGANWMHIAGGGLSGWCVQAGLRPR